MRIRLASWSAASRARCSSGEILGLAGAAFSAGFAAGFAGKCRVFLDRSGIVRGISRRGLTSILASQVGARQPPTAAITVLCDIGSVDAQSARLELPDGGDG